MATLMVGSLIWTLDAWTVMQIMHTKLCLQDRALSMNTVPIKLFNMKNDEKW